MSENLKKSQGGCLSCLSSPMFAFATCCKVEGAELLVFGVEKMGGWGGGESGLRLCHGQVRKKVGIDL